MVTAKIDVSSLQTSLSKTLFWLIIFLSSTQLGLHFWPSSSLVYGVRIDYLAPTLYFIDCLIILYLALSQQFRSFSGLQHSARQLITSVIPLLLTNLLYSQNPLSTLSWSLHLLLYLAFLGTIIPQSTTSTIIPPLTFSIIFQLVLALAQFTLGHSLGSFMYYFGERMLSVGSPNVALASFMGQVALRSYGTFSHPNILAGWLVVSILILVRLAPKFRTFVLIISSLGIFLTQSRSAALAFFVIVTPLYLLKTIKARVSYLLLFCVTVSLCYGATDFFTPSRTTLSYTQRLDLQLLSSKIIAAYPVFGSGAQSSITTYPALAPTMRVLQPDHNSLTLFLSWFGIFGLLPLFSQFRSLRDFRRAIGTFVVPLLPILPLLLFDHYLLTSPQGLFSFLLFLHVNMWISHDLKTQNYRH